MKITDHLERAGTRTLISFEILPPLKGGGMQSIFDILDPLMDYKPPFIDVTYHREEFEYVQRPTGYYEKIAIRKRPGTVGICAAIQNKYGVEAVPHLICGGFTKEETENALIDLNFLGIQNILALRGDARKFEATFVAHPGGHNYAIDLVRQANNMNKGIYLDEHIVNGNSTDFCVGVAGYPEKHFEAPNIDTDLHYLKEKIDAGAAYIVTQMFFDNTKFFEFVNACRNIGITVPIIPGLKPITRRGQLNAIPRSFYINLPSDLVSAIRNCKDEASVKQVGIEWCIAQSLELKASGVPCLHYYTMGDVKTFKTICSKVI